MGRSVLFFWAIALIASVINADIPTTTPGFVYKRGLHTAPVKLQIFIDFLCPFSKAAYPAMRKLEQAFEGSQLQITFQVLPLPFHKHAFTVAQSASTLVHLLGIEVFPVWAETIFANQDRLYNEPTKDMTAVQVVELLFQWAQTAFPKLAHEAWAKQMTGHGGSDMDEKTRQLFRYSLAHGIGGTPMFYLNGVHFEEGDSSWTFEQWHKVIKPLVDANQQKSHEIDTNGVLMMATQRRLPDRRVYYSAKSNVCDEIGRHCEYLTGQTMCCNDDEACIINHGCKRF
ncbi:hypothetical protein THRCLA_08725 [Thraustotheca clavata]|uniref:Uncharacterized protein n=1 Tax=Thraustotheca clavata TaxID=74557 RepID=A0A1V9Z380_9STRA|nr:hypothetical protein THRCLA_08725 [Thraustotheca clavata]